MIWVKAHTRNGYKISGFWRRSKGEKVVEERAGTRITFYEEDGKKKMRGETFNGKEWKEVFNNDVKEKDYQKGIQAIGDRKRLIEACVNGDDVESAGKEFEQKYGREETAKVVNEAKERIREDVIADIEGCEDGRMPFYEDELRTKYKMDYLQDKYGDTEEEASKRAEEVYRIGDSKISQTRKLVDGGGNIYYMGISEDGTQRMIPPILYEKRTIIKGDV